METGGRFMQGQAFPLFLNGQFSHLAWDLRDSSAGACGQSSGQFSRSPLTM